jgi:anti-sigma B factor antagonist
MRRVSPKGAEMGMDLEANILEVDDRVIVAVAGSLDGYTAQRFRQTLAEVASSRPRAVDIDMLHVNFMDSIGIGALHSGIETIEAVGGVVSVLVGMYQNRILARLGLTGPLRLVLPESRVLTRT